MLSADWLFKKRKRRISSSLSKVFIVRGTVEDSMLHRHGVVLWVVVAFLLFFFCSFFFVVCCCCCFKCLLLHFCFKKLLFVLGLRGGFFFGGWGFVWGFPLFSLKKIIIMWAL